MAARKKPAAAADFDGFSTKLNVDISWPTAPMMPAYIETKRFHWVFLGDSFFYPFVIATGGSNPDHGESTLVAERKCSAAAKETGSVEACPGSAGSVAFVHKTREGQPEGGWGHQNSKAAYFRSLNFTAPLETMRKKFQQIPLGWRDGSPKTSNLQRLHFPRITDEAGRLHLPMHFQQCRGH